ncbi:hypothetical protein [Flavobacterium suncheonense]|uniref:hypothetical protein n=1 Tax=Flavobacterium suncheonense TaxID=350894 RepID=UPI003FA37A08
MKRLFVLFFIIFNYTMIGQTYTFNQFINYKVKMKSSRYETLVFADSLRTDYILKLYLSNLAQDNARIFDKKNGEVHFLKLKETKTSMTAEYLYTVKMKESDKFKTPELIVVDSTQVILRSFHYKKKQLNYDVICKIKPGSKVKNGLFLYMSSTKGGASYDEYKNAPLGLIETVVEEYGSTKLLSYETVQMEIRIPTIKKYEESPRFY